MPPPPASSPAVSAAPGTPPHRSGAGGTFPDDVTRRPDPARILPRRTALARPPPADPTRLVQFVTSHWTLARTRHSLCYARTARAHGDGQQHGRRRALSNCVPCMRPQREDSAHGGRSPSHSPLRGPTIGLSAGRVREAVASPPPNGRTVGGMRPSWDHPSAHSSRLFRNAGDGFIPQSALDCAELTLQLARRCCTRNVRRVPARFIEACVQPYARPCVHRQRACGEARSATYAAALRTAPVSTALRAGVSLGRHRPTSTSKRILHVRLRESTGPHAARTDPAQRPKRPSCTVYERFHKLPRGCATIGVAKV
jgi:hypothetical protein